MEQTYKSGFATIIGRPNVGKSTLMNSIVKEKIAIVSDKPQTTRNRIMAIVTREDAQIIFIDTPGIHKPKNKLGEYMLRAAEDTLKEVDVILYMVQADAKIGTGERKIIERFEQIHTPVVLVINKIDLLTKQEILPVIQQYQALYSFKAIIPISALHQDGIDLISEEITKILPPGPKFFPDDMITDQPERQIVSEMIREKVLHHLAKEVPHGIAVEITSMHHQEHKNLIKIDANIYCEKASHKGIIIGNKGEMLKKIGSLAREDIENLLGSKIFLELWVKVKKDWRNSTFFVKNFGYK